MKNNYKLNEVLFIEDCEMTRTFVKEIFESRNIKITCVSTGLDAIKEINQKNFDVVLMDLSFPAGTPEDIVKRIKLINPNTPIAICSGAYNIVEKAQKLGVDGYLRKPYKIESLLDMSKDIYSKKFEQISKLAI